MASSCKSAIGCIDARIPARASYVNLYKWPESDAEFVKSVITGRDNKNPMKQGPQVVDSYSCRQMYLRSYTFSKKESMPEKTRKCLGKVKQKASVFPFITTSTSGNGSIKSESNKKKRKKKKKKKKNSCVTVKRLKEVSYAAICSVFQRLLSCTTSVDVARNRSTPQIGSRDESHGHAYSSLLV